MNVGRNGFLISNFEFLITGLPAVVCARIQNQKSEIRNQKFEITAVPPRMVRP